ncbi:MAG: hypothetical protein KME55_23955 [Nostoc indistinguendum CM1-VF10]|nr:hypothetical protein [Nostoc indistinguendum CM1-VF10]
MARSFRVGAGRSGDRWNGVLRGKDSGQGVLTSVTSEVEYHNYGKRPASETRA